jgi:N-acetylmuramoyl-L-alanine amidase
MSPNTGAEGNGVREQDISYEVGLRLYELLNQNPSFEAKLSRPTRNTQLGTSNSSSLQTRVNDANNWGADYFISIHTNASVSPNAPGTEVLVYRAPSVAANLAEDVLQGVVDASGFPNRGVKQRPGLYVLRKTNMPAILVELGYITNADDVRKMTEDPWGFAQGIYNGILDYFDFD